MQAAEHPRGIAWAWCARLCAILVTAACSHAGGDAASDPDAAAGHPITVVDESVQRCKLLDTNAVAFRANVGGADLGIPVATADRLYLLFGDTIGFAGIWGAGESHPDAVGYVEGDPCDGLRILTLSPADSTGPSVDPRVEADFAGAAMIAPPGHDLGEYIHNPAGPFPNLPGDFEVPSGAVSIGGAIYVFYTTVVSPADHTMVASYVARWDAPATAGIPAYQIVASLDDADFINVAAVAAGDRVYLFGTGAFRASPVYLARTRDLDARPVQIERYDATTGTWATGDGGGAPIIPVAGHGETSVRYFADLDRWMFLAEEITPEANRIVARFAERPEGPWSDAIVVHDMADPAFRARYCCATADACDGEQFLHCERTGFYGTYLFPEAEVGLDGRFSVTYTMSSFDPYSVVLFRTTFR